MLLMHTPRAKYLIIFVTSIGIAQARTFTFREALWHALEHSPELQSEVHQKEIARLQLTNHRAKLLPSLDFSATHGLNKAYPSQPTDPWLSRFSLSLTESLYDNGETFTRINIAELKQRTADLNYVKARDKLCLDIINLYLQYSRDKLLLIAKEKQLELLRKQFQQVKRQYQQGMKLRRDLLRFLASVQQAEMQVADAAAGITKTKNDIAAQIASSMDEDNNFVPLELTDKLFTMNFATAPDPNKSYDVILAKLEADVLSNQVDLARRKYWPEINLKAQADYHNANYLGSTLSFGANESYFGMIGLTVNFNLLDWGIRRREIDMGERNRLIGETKNRKTELSATLESKQIMLQLQRLQTQQSLNEELLKYEEENFTNLKRDYEEGKIAAFDFISHFKTILDSRISLVSTQFSLAETRARYHFLQGQLYETIHHP